MIQELRAIMSPTKAQEVHGKLQNCGIYTTRQLSGKHIPAHFGTDLDGFNTNVLGRFERWLNKHRAVLVR